MELKFQDLRTMLSHTINTDNTFYVSYNDENNRVISYTRNGFNSFTQRLSNLLLEFVYNKIENFTYFIDPKGLHYLVNVDMIDKIFVDNNITNIIFNNQIKLTSSGVYAYQAIQKTIEQRNESQERTEIHSDSQVNSGS